MTTTRGHIRRRGRTSWELKWDSKSESGERITKYRSFKGTSREASLKLAEYVTADKDRSYVDLSKSPFPSTSESASEYGKRWRQ